MAHTQNSVNDDCDLMKIKGKLTEPKLENGNNNDDQENEKNEW